MAESGIEALGGGKRARVWASGLFVYRYREWCPQGFLQLMSVGCPCLVIQSPVPAAREDGPRRTAALFIEPDWAAGAGRIINPPGRI